MIRVDENIKNLFKRLSGGDSEAFEAIFKTFYAPLVHFSYTITQNKESAEDIVSDVFCNMWGDRRNYKSIEKGKSYLFRSVHNRSVDFIRRSKKISDQEITESDLILEFDELDIFEIDILARLNTLVYDLPEKCSNILRLKLEGYNDHQISEQLGIKYETVRSHQKRGIKILRDNLTKLYTIIIYIG